MPCVASRVNLNRSSSQHKKNTPYLREQGQIIVTLYNSCISTLQVSFAPTHTLLSIDPAKLCGQAVR